VAEREKAREAGRQAMRLLRTTLAERLADTIKRDPRRLAAAVDVGLVSREWLDHPGEVPVSGATPVAVVQRYLERSVEREPSTLAALGLSALQLLALAGDAPEPGAGRTERLAVAFTDMEGFTAFTAAEGDGAASRLLAEHHGVVGPIVRGRGGKVVKRIGDGSLLTFPAPEAAVLAVLEIVDQCREPLAVRAGVHTGEVVVTGDDVVGNVVNVAARVTEVAAAGTVLVTAAVRDEVDLAGVEFGRPRRRAFKGVDGSTQVYRASRRT
jgi:adenylate cyclase